jgi:hypothetical protein
MDYRAARRLFAHLGVWVCFAPDPTRYLPTGRGWIPRGWLVETVHTRRAVLGGYDPARMLFRGLAPYGLNRNPSSSLLGKRT